MNFRIIFRMLSIVAMLIGVTMIFSLPWAMPTLGWRKDLPQPEEFEQAGFLALLASLIVSLLVAGILYWLGRDAKGDLFRKEAMAVVGLSWVLATVLGALPFLFHGTQRYDGQRMSIGDALFESQSGFSTTGATVISELEDPELVPHCILFWRSSTHFLGGLGIIVLFVVLLGQGSAGKAMMRAEMPGPTKEGGTERMQHAAWQFAVLYCAMNVALALILWAMGLSLFDALCHAFGTLATGGFSTYNSSVGHFDSPAIDYVIILFMFLAGTNFALLYTLLLGAPRRRTENPRFFDRFGMIWEDVEFRVYTGIILAVTLIVVVVGLYYQSFANFLDAVRFGLFQVVAIITTTGYGTNDFDGWAHFSRALLLLLMFVGGCAGSTGGGLKVIRHILFVKILGVELERAYRPNVVRPLRLGKIVIEDSSLHNNILVYFALILAIFIWSWILLVAWEPDATWVETAKQERQQVVTQNKLVDSASAVAATLNNIGPGLGTVGATRNYGHFSEGAKVLFVVLMMIGRLEIFSIAVLFIPRFWRA